MTAIARHPRLAGAVSLFLLLTLAYSFSAGLRATTGASITGDEPFYLMTTKSLIDDGDLDLTQQYERESYRSFFDHPDGLWRQSVEMDDGRLLSPHEPGLSVLVIPGFLLDGLRGVQVQLMLLATLTFSLAFVLTSLETGLLRLSWLSTAAVGLSTSVFVYSTEVYPELPAALCLVTALLLVRNRAGGVWSGLGLALILTALMWFGLKYAPLAALVTIPFLLSANRSGRLTLIALGAVSGVFYVWFHYAVFDDLTAYSVNTVYEGAGAVSVFESHVAFQERIYRLWGLLIDQRFGLGRWAPFLLLLVPALPLLLKQGRMGLTVFGLIGAQVLIATFVAITMMGWWFPGRTLMVVAPLFPLALVPLIARLPLAGRVVAGVLAAASVAFTVALQRASAAHEVRLAVDPFDMTWAPFRWSAHLFPNYQAWTAETVVLTALWLSLFSLAIGGVVWTAFRSEIDAAYGNLRLRRAGLNGRLTLRRG